VPPLLRHFLRDLVTFEYFSGAVLIGLVALVAGLATWTPFIALLGVLLIGLGLRMWFKRRGQPETG